MKNPNKNTYKCPMHPDIKSDKEEQCPKCNMDLVKENSQPQHLKTALGSRGKKEMKNHGVSADGKNEPVATKADRKKTKYHKQLFLMLLVFFLSLSWFLWVIWYKVIPHEVKQVHYHAGFIVVKNNQQESFSDQKYMKTEACTDSSAGHQGSEQEEQIEKAHLHGNVGDVVHVENEEGKWKDLFTNIKYDINYSDTESYLNGKKITGFENRSIKPYDSLVIFISNGNEVDKFLPQAVTKAHIQEAESASEDCGGH